MNMPPHVVFWKQMCSLSALAVESFQRARAFGPLGIVLPGLKGRSRSSNQTWKLQISSLSVTEPKESLSRSCGFWIDEKSLLDFRNPHEWYSIARSVHRRIVYHAGKQMTDFLEFLFEISCRSHQQRQDIHGSTTIQRKRTGCLLCTAPSLGNGNS